MSEASNSLLLRFARWQVRALVRVWPQQSRKWGQALASEAEEIQLPLEGVRWALGGVVVFSRALGSHLLTWCKLPVGGQSSAGLGPLTNAPGPRRSRLFTAAVLIGAALLLCIPEGREATATLKATWDEFVQSDVDRKELEKIANRAEKENDARTMAFASLSRMDEKRKVDLAERAVALDPRLFWIYAAQRFGRSYGPQHVPAKVEWVATVQAADPDNAVPYFFAADEMAERQFAGFYEHHSPTETEIENGLATNAAWVALMDRAFHAARYDSYYQEHAELNREIWNREPRLSLSAAFAGLWGHSIPNVLYLKTFTLYLIRRAQEERAAGHPARGEELLREADAFCKRLQQKDGTRIENWVGRSLERTVALGWKSFYEAAGRADEAQAAAQRAAQIEQHSRDLAAQQQRIWQNRTSRGTNAWIVEISAILMLIAAIAAIFSIGLFELWPAIWRSKAVLRRVLCFVADFAPAMVLATCAVFLVSFLPYARLFAAFRSRSTGAPGEEQLSMAFWSLLSVTETISGADAAVLGWTVLIVVLSVFLALLLARMLYRALRAPAPQI